MDSVRFLTKLPIAPFQDFLSKCDEPFEKSLLYSSAEDAKFVDEERRKSVFRTIADPNLFDLLETTIISDLNKTDESFQYMLCRNDITHILYEKGGFFKRHKDYLSLTSNLIQEFTLLVCVTPGEGKVADGGETTIFASFGGASKTYDTSTPGCGILFRKDLEHEGSLLKNGDKHILTANLWAIRKEKSNQVLLVVFPSYTSDPNTTTTAADAMERAACSNSSYVLPVDILTGMLAAHVQWVNRAAEQQGKDLPAVVTYECRDFDYESFGVVVKILNRSYIGEDAIETHKECLDYFGPFKAENLLVDLAVLSKSPEDKGSPLHKKQKSRKKDKTPESANDKSTFDSQVIVCENEARMKAVCNVAKALNEPYVPFKILFVEGVLTFRYDGGMCPLKIPMTAAACLLGDYNNILTMRRLSVKASCIKERSIHDIHDKSNFARAKPEKFKSLVPGAQVSESDLCSECSYEELWDYDDIGLSLQIAYNESNDARVKSQVLGSVLHSAYDGILGCPKLKFLPGLDLVDRKNDNTHPAGSGKNGFFHYNQEGKVCFSKEEAEAASDFIASIQLDQRVKASLQKKRFEIPQQESDVDVEFCNESVYGNVNILWVCGAVRLGDSKESGESSTSGSSSENATVTNFDAWPNPKQKRNTERELKRIQALASEWDY